MVSIPPSGVSAGQTGRLSYYTPVVKKIKLLFGRVQMSRRVVVYVSPWCSQSQDTKRALEEWGVACTIVDIKADPAAAARVRKWVGHESVPTVVIAEEGSLEPYEPPKALMPGSGPRGVDRGSMITEASRAELRGWLVQHGLLDR
jgi:glutaredoxin